MLGSGKKKKVKEFKNVTGCSDTDAKRFLEANGYNLDMAVNNFFNQQSAQSSRSKSGGASKKVSKTALEKLFKKYAGEGDDADCIVEEKLETFFEDIGVDIEGPMPTAVFWALKCKENGEIKKAEFVDGFSALGAGALDGMKRKVAELGKTLNKNGNQFKEFYKWLFMFSRDSDQRKTIDTEIALEMWELYLPGHFALAQKFVDFWKSRDEKTVRQDLWDMVVEFAMDMEKFGWKSDLSNYEDAGAWPIALDDFVEYVQEGK